MMMDMGDAARSMLKMIHDNHELDLTNKRQATSLIEMQNVLTTLSSTCKICRKSVSAFDILEHWKPHLDLDPTLEMDADTISILDHIRSLEELEAVVKEQALIVEDTNNFIAANKVNCLKCDNLISATNFSSHWDDHPVVETAENAVFGHIGCNPVDNLLHYAENLFSAPMSQEQQLSIAEHHEDYHETFFRNLFEDQNTLGIGLHVPGPSAAAQPFQAPGIDVQHHPAPHGVGATAAAAAAAEGQPVLGPQNVNQPGLGVAEGEPVEDPQNVNQPGLGIAEGEPVEDPQHVYPPANVPNPCLVCAFLGEIVSFPRKQDLVQHKRNVHMNLAAGVCAHCPRRGDYTALSNHLPRHYPPRPYPCPRPGCALVYNNPRSLSAHLKRPH